MSKKNEENNNELIERAVKKYLEEEKQQEDIKIEQPVQTQEDFINTQELVNRIISKPVVEDSFVEDIEEVPKPPKKKFFNFKKKEKKATPEEPEKIIKTIKIVDANFKRVFFSMIAGVTLTTAVCIILFYGSDHAFINSALILFVMTLGTLKEVSEIK